MMPPSAWVVLHLNFAGDTWSAFLTPAMEGQVEDAVSAYLNAGRQRDWLVRGLETVDGATLTVPVSAITHWVTGTPTTYQSTVAFEAWRSAKGQEAEKDAGLDTERGF